MIPIIKKSILLLFSTVVVFSTNSQNVHWVNTFGKSGNDRANKIACDANGNVYMAGTFTGSNVAFGSFTLSSNNNSNDIFAAKMDAKGDCLWAVRIGGSVNEPDECALEIDAFDNLFITGGIVNTATFGSTDGNNNSKTSTGKTDFFIARYSSDGVLDWVQTATGLGDDNANDLCTDKDGNVYAVGHYGHNGNTAKFGSTTLKAASSYDMFITKLDSSGNFVWSKSEGGNGDDWGSGVTCDDFGNVYFSAEYGYGGTQTTLAGQSVPTKGGWDGSLIKYRASDGSPVWVRTFNSNGGEVLTIVKTDKYGNIFGFGYYQTNTIFKSGNASLNPPNSDPSSVMLMKYDSNGIIHWISYGATSSLAGAYDMSFNKEKDSIIVCGFTPDDMQFNGSNNYVISAPLSFYYAMFDTADNFGRAKTFGSSNGSVNYAVGVCYDKFDNIFVSGFFQNSIDFGGTTKSSNGQSIDGFLMKYGDKTGGNEGQTGFDKYQGSFSNLSLYPNPSNVSTLLTFRINSSSSLKIQISSIEGKTVWETNAHKILAGDHSTTLSTEQLSEGIYIVRLITEGTSTNSKLVVKR